MCLCISSRRKPGVRPVSLRPGPRLNIRPSPRLRPGLTSAAPTEAPEAPAETAAPEAPATEAENEARPIYSVKYINSNK